MASPNVPFRDVGVCISISQVLAQGSGQLDHQRWIEARVFDYALGRITARIGDDPRAADLVVATVVHMAMQPQGGLPAFDLCLQVRDKAGVQRRADKPGGDAAARR